MQSSRKTFLMGLAGAAVASTARSIPRLNFAPDRVKLAVVGAGGRGADDLKDLVATDAVEVVALCDCDPRQAAGSIKNHPKASIYTDWRKLLEHYKEFDAILVATPDHNHAPISISAMNLGKHVYCEKPLAHSVWEARKMSEVSKQKRVVTQMGTQGHAYEGTRRAVEVMRAGILGEVKELHVWTDRPAGWWPQGVRRPEIGEPQPPGLDWDVWLGPAPNAVYHSAYLPFKWRGFWDYGTGAIGDMGIHNLDTAYWGLELGLPTSVHVLDCSGKTGDPEMRDSAPLWSISELHFPARGKQPAIKMFWYDGGKLPPKELFKGEELYSKDGGSLIIGSKGTLFTRTWHGGENESDMFKLMMNDPHEGWTPKIQTLPRTKSHHQEFVDACRGMGKTQSHFGYAARLTESLLLANVAIRTGKEIIWDARAMKATGVPEADRFLHPEFRSGWGV